MTSFNGQGSVVTLAEGVRVGIGTVVCKGAMPDLNASQIAYGPPRLLAADGSVLDNPNDVTGQWLINDFNYSY